MIVLTVLGRAPARANALVLVLDLICSLALVYTWARVFVRFQRIHHRAALFDRARGPCRPADPDTAGKAIE